MKKRGDGDGVVTLPSILKPINHYVDELFKKSGSKREDALASIIRILSCKMLTNFVVENFATLLYRFLNSFKKGSPRERDLACNALGLLAMTIHCRDKTHEIYDESTPLLSKALNSGSLKLLESLAIITFFCAENSDETESMMQIIWANIHQERGSTATENADKKLALVTAWSFLLSTLDGWRISCKCWKGAISYFSRLLEDEALCVVASEALSLIYESGSPGKFSGDLFACNDEVIHDTIFSAENNFSAKELNEEMDKLVQSRISDLILNTVFSAEINSSAKELNEEMDKLDQSRISDLKLDVSKYSQDTPVTSVKIGKEKIILSTRAQMVQLEFIKKFLGKEGFDLHMRENELVRDVFEFKTNKDHNSGCKLYVSEEEKLVKRYHVPAASRADEDDMLPFISSKKKGILQRMTKSRNSAKSKARTQLMNKKRLQSEERHTGHFVSGD